MTFYILQAANLLKRTEGLVTLVVSNPGKRSSTPLPEVDKCSESKPALKLTVPSRPTTPVPGKYSNCCELPKYPRVLL